MRLSQAPNWDGTFYRSCTAKAGAPCDLKSVLLGDRHHSKRGSISIETINSHNECVVARMIKRETYEAKG